MFSLIEQAFEKWRRERRQSRVVTFLDVPPIVGRNGEKKRRWVAVLLCVPSLFITMAYAGEMVKFEASSAYTSEKVILSADISKPKGDGPFPAVVLMHGCGGWQPAVRFTMKGYTDFLVDNGFVVLNLDSFGPRNNGGGKVCESIKRLTDAVNYRTHDAYDALRYLQTQKYVAGNNIFLMGQSNGGSVAINVAKVDAPLDKKSKDEGFRAVVAYYPWCGTFGARKVELASPLLVFGGGKDDWVPSHQCEGIESTGAELQLKIYPEAAHSFDLEIMPQRYLGKLVGKNDFAAEDSRRRMLAFFIEHSTSDILKASYLAEN